MKKKLSILLFLAMFFMLFTTEAQNYALSFTNQNCYARIPADVSLELSGSLTLEAWIYPTSWKTNVYQGCIVNKEGIDYQGYMLRCGANGTLNFNIGTGTTWKEISSSSGALTLNTWQHIAGVYDGTVLKIYVNGVQVGSTTAYTGVVATNSAIPLEIGRAFNYNDRNFPGRIDEVRIWNTAVSATDIAANYNTTITSAHPNYSSLVGYYEMDNFSNDSDSDGNMDLTATIGIPGEVFTAPYGPACNSLFTSSAPAGNTAVFAQQTTTIPATIGNTNIHVLKLIVDVFNTGTATQLNFQTNGTTNVSDIVNAKLWYTGNSGTFATTTQFGTTIATPPAANNNMTFTGSQTLTCGRHFFWLTYDIPPTATPNNVIDATFQDITIDAIPYTSASSNPAGNRQISTLCPHTLRLTATTSGGWNGGLVDLTVNGTTVISAFGSSFVSGTGPYDTTFYAATSDVISIVRVADGTYPTRMRVQVLDGNGTIKLAAIEPTSTGVGTTGFCGGLAFTTAATLINPTSVQLNGYYTNCFPTEAGFRYKKLFESNYTYVQSTNGIITYDLQGLSPATNYHYQTYVIVGTDTILGSIINFATSCGNITSIPWYDSFDTYSTGSGILPSCWTRNTAGSTTAPYVNSTNFSSPGSLYFSASSTTINRVMAVTPMFDASIPINTLKAEFKMRATGTDDTLLIGVMTDPLDASTFVTVGTKVLSTTGTFQDIEFYFNNYIGSGQYIAFRVNYGPTSSTIYIDNLLISAIPSCPRPNTLTSSNITTNSADLAWFEFGNATSWEIEYGPVGFVQGTGTIVTANSNPYTLSGLNHSTQYTYYVKAVCSGTDQSIWSLGSSFWTACGAITNLPWIENFDTFGTGSGILPRCWTRNSVGSTTAPYINSTNYSSPGSLYFSASSTTINRIVAITPMFDLSVPINTLKAEFKMRASGTDDTLYIGVMSDPLDYSTFIPVDKKVLSTTGTYFDTEVFFNNYSGTGQYIAFSVSYGPSSAVVYIDNLNINTIPSCPRPTLPTSSNPTTSSIDLAWVEYGNATQWVVEYGPVGFTQGTGTYVTVNSNPYTLQGLNPSSQYTYYVKAVCSPTDESVWSTSNTFTTQCVPQSNLPIVESCETTPLNELPLCFSSLVSGSATVRVESYNSNKVINMNAGATTNNCFLIFPALTDPVNTIRIQFKYIGGDNHLFKIGYLTDIADASTFQMIHNAPLSGTGTWKSFDIITSNTMMGNERIAIKFEMPSSYYAYLDSVTISLQPPCVEPSSLALVNSNINDLTVSWVTSATSSNLEYKESTSSTWIPLNGVTSPYTVPGLNQNTQYNFRVQSVCDGGILSNFSPISTFSTLCDLISVLPYVQDFETTAINEIPSCYNKIQSGYGTVKVIDLTIEEPQAGKVLQMDFSTSSSGEAYIVLPKFNFPVNTLRIGFKYYGGNANHRIGYVTDPALASSFVEVINQTLVGVSGGIWYYFDIITNNTLTGNERIAIRYNPGAGWYNNRYDSLTVMAMPNCMAPIGLTASAITTTDASLSWNVVGTGVPVDFNLEYRVTGSSTWTTISNVTNPFTLPGLSPNTTYQYHVQANCGNGELSEWSSIASFTTACGAITTVPWSDSFDTYTSGSFPACWSKVSSSTTYPQISTGYTASAPASLYFLNAVSGAYHYVSTPQFDSSIPINTLKASFKMRATGLDDTLYVGVMSNPMDTTTFQLIAKKIPTTVNTFEDMDVYFSNYTGIGQYIAFLGKYTSSASYIFMDNVVVSTIPACPVPSGLTASNISSNSVDCSWIENGTASSWIIEYGPVGFIPGTGTIISNVSSNPYTLSGLTPNTAYQIYVQSNCGGLNSDYSSSVTITTGLIPVNLPYVNDFENASSNSDFAFLNGTQNNKWYIGNAAGVNNTVGGSNALYISNDGGTTWAYTPGSGSSASKVYAYIDVNVPAGANEILLDFDWIAKGFNASYDFLRVYMMPLNIPISAGNIPPTVNSVNYDLNGQIGYYTGGTGEHWLSQQTTWQHKQFSINSTQFPTLAGNTWRIYFHWRNEQTSGSQPPATVDNISITVATCPAPNNLHTNSISATTVDLAWTENGTATSWTVEYGSAGFTLGTGTQLTASTNPFTVPGLTSATTYDFYVKSNCGTGSYSGWTNKVTATTSCISTSIPFNESFNNTTIPNCWSQTYSGALTSNRWSVSTGSQAGGSPNQMMCSYVQAVGISRLISPSIDFGQVTNPTLIFKYMLDDYGVGATMKIQTSTDLVNWTDQPFTLTSTSNTNVGPAIANIILNIPGGVNYVAWVVDGDHYQIDYWYIDDVSITSSNLSCNTPTNLAVSAITSSTATATWTAGGTETQWEVAYKPTSASTWNFDIVSAPTYNFSTLTAATAYDVKVRAICAAGDTSAYTSIVNFTTGTQSCNAPTNLTAATITTSGATITWTAGGTETSWELDYKLASASTWTTVTVNTTPSHVFNTLLPATAYNVRVRAICGTGLFSDYTTIVNFTTATPPCNVPTNLQVPTAGITDQTAVVTWTAGGTETQWQVEYKLVSSSNWTTMTPSTSPTQLIQALQSNSTYEVRVKALCGGSNESPFTTSVQFTTTGAGTYTITASAIGSGTITPNGTVTVTAGANQLFTFTPASGNIVVSLLVDNQSTPVTNNQYEFTNVLANHTIVVEFGVGIDENNGSDMVTLYPNPTNSTIELKINQTQLQVRECQLYDIYGKLIKVISVHEENTKIDVSEYASGVYFIRMNSEMGVITKKFVKK